MTALARPAWLAFATFAGALAAVALARWAWAVTLGGPILYGEGAVAHAAILARDGAEYASYPPPAFVAASYTPLYYHVASLGDPFVWGRIVSIGCTLIVAAAIAWRARAAGAVVALALAAAWLALAPVAIWGPAVRVDLLALALTVGAVLVAERAATRGQGWAVLAGALIALAVAAKPTAALPGLALGAWFILARRPRSAGAYATGGIVTTALVLIATPGGLAAIRRNVIDNNALPWSAEPVLLLAAVALFVVGVPVIGALALRAARGAVAAYLVGAAGILVLGGREGASINYLLDLSAAATLALASIAPRLGPSALAPALAAAQLVAGIVLLDPLGAPGRTGTGAWASPDRIAVARTLPAGPVLAEESGLLVALGRDPIVDDLFLWSRLADRGAIDREPLLRAIRAGEFVRVVSEADLAALDAAPAYERQRWPAWLAAAVLERYTLDQREAGLHIYRPR